MATTSERALARRGRWMYELGRARWASRVLIVVVLLLILARIIGRPMPLVIALGGLLGVGGFAAAMLHERYARAFRIGVIAGIPAFLLPLLVRALHLVPPAVGVDPCVPASFLSGILAGWAISRLSLDEQHRLAFWTVAIVTTALTGSLGCSVAGGGGVLGMIAGVVTGSAPVVLRSATQRS